MTDRERIQDRPQVRLRPVEPGDVPALYEIQADPESNRMAAVIPRTREAFEALWRKILADPTIIGRAILAEEMLVGSISCFKQDGRDSVGYWIAREYWGKGIATRALQLLLQEVPARPLHARAARANTASLRVLQRCGFVVVEYRVSPGDERYLECEEAVHVLR